MVEVTRAGISAALELVQAAYQEAMEQAGMLQGKMAEVHAYAAINLEALESLQSETDVGAGPDRGSVAG